MSLKNTVRNYGLIARTLHWLTALLFLGAYMAVYYRQWFTEQKTPENWNALQLHLSFGISIGVLVFLRILWKVMNESPALEPGPKWQHLAAHVGHYALYFVMIAMPLTGYLGTGADTDYFFLFEIPKFESTFWNQMLVIDGLGITYKEFEEPLDFFHKEIMGPVVVWMLIVGHAGAALYHHFIHKDRTLIKMTRGR